MIETMHQSDQGECDVDKKCQYLIARICFQQSAGVFRRMIDEVRKYVLKKHTNKGLELMDKRMSRLWEMGFIQNFRVPTVKVWEKGVSLQANELRSIMQVCDLMIMCYLMFIC